MTPNHAAEAATFVDEEHGLALAIYRLSIDGKSADIAFFIVDPSSLRRRIGSAICRHHFDECRRCGRTRDRFTSDLNAVPFSQPLGALQVGTVASESLLGRRLPLLAYKLEAP